MKHNLSILHLIVTLLFLSFTAPVFAQNIFPTDSAIADHLIDHEQFLKKARPEQDSSTYSPILENISMYFQEKSYQPGGDDSSFFKDYAIRVGRKLKGDNYFKINRFTYEIGKDYYPLPQSGNGEVKSKLLDVNFGIHAPSMNYNDYKDFNTRELQDQAFLMRLSTPDGYNEQSPFKKYANIEAKTKEAISRGASAVIFSNLDPNLSPPEFKINTITDTFDIPVLYLKEKHYRKLEYDYDYKTILRVSIEEILKRGRNFYAFRDANADQTLVISSTYQPRDSTSERNQLSKAKSGLPILMEWANRVTSDSLAKSYNILFALLPDDSTFQKGWQELTNKDLLKNGSSSYYHLAVDMPSSFLKEAKAVHPENIDPKWEESVAKTDSNISFSGASNQGKLSKATSFYHADDHNVLHFSTKDSAFSAQEITKTGLKFLHTLNDTSSIADSLQKQASIIHSLFIPDYTYRNQGIRLQTVRNKQLKKNNIERGTIIRKLNGKNIQQFSTFLNRLDKLDKKEPIILQLDNQTKTFQIKIQHPFGTDTQY